MIIVKFFKKCVTSSQLPNQLSEIYCRLYAFYTKKQKNDMDSSWYLLSALHL